MAEKTQHVDQLMRERDLERGEVARMAMQLDEATQLAHEFKTQLDQVSKLVRVNFYSLKFYFQ